MSTITAQFLDRPIFRIVSEVAAERGVRAFVIGGFVRDCFLGRPRADIDIVVEGSGIDFAKAVGQKTNQHVSYFKTFGTAMLHFRGDEVEFVGARKESYRRESRKPIVENGTLEDDQQRRDFTINAMAFSLQPEDFGALVDPFGGIRDLNDGIIRTGETILDILSRKKFNQVLSRHKRSPYNEWWLAQDDPFLLAHNPEILNERVNLNKKKGGRK